MQNLKKLPIGIQTFKDIRVGDYLYIDKTEIAHKLISNHRYIFLSRPRRFGKSLFLDTLQNIFEAKKELFRGLAIYDKYDWNGSYPVIKINFANGRIESREELDKKLISILKYNQENLEVEYENIEDVSICFETLIRNTYKKYNKKVVILVDEYDKPILDNITDIEIAKQLRNGLVNLYNVIKGCDEYIQFVFLTGVSKFTKTSIFSGLNNLEDISLNPEYGNICGYTQKDIETDFLPYLEGQDFEKIRKWYNGYNFLKDPMYNPFDILLFIKNNYLYDNYWFSTGTPTFLIELIKSNNYFLPKLSNLVVDKKLLDSFDIENLDFEVILYQTGYLTIDEMIIDEDDYIEYRLKIPNIEVKKSLNDSIIHRLLRNNNSRTQSKPILMALKKAKLEDLEIAFTSMFASIANDNYRKNEIYKYEGFYASMLYVYLQSLGCDVIGEDVTNRGRIDLTIKINNIIYILEFKMGSGDAMAQIKEKKYYEKYLSLKEPIYLVGINFDENIKNISKFEWELM